MAVGISTACFYPEQTEESLGKILTLQPPCVEVFLNAGCELEPGYLKKLRSMADRAGTRIVSVHPYLSAMEPMFFFSLYDRRFAEGLELYRRFWQAAAILGADTVVFHGNHRMSPLPLEEYFGRFDRLWQDARAAGVSLCQENVERCTSRSAGFFRAMGKALPEVRYILDVKQVIRAGEDLSEMVDAMGGRVRHIHMSDHNEGESCLVPGKGVLNISKLLIDTMSRGFSGSVIVELYRENFRDIVELSRGFQHLSLILSTLSNIH